jgi:hypothetical protein
MRLMVLLGVMVLLLSCVAPPAAADPGGSPNANADYGQHHADHARDGHLGGDMNPGMHEGKSGWDPSHSH